MSESEVPEWMPLLLREYEYHRTGIDKLDSQRLQIRSWAITVIGALVAVSFSAKVELLPFSGIAIVLLFGFLETVYMGMQHDVIQRSNQLERILNHYRMDGALQEPYEFGVSHAYRGNFYFRDIPRILFTRGRLHITSFYLALCIVSALAGIAALLSAK